MFAKIGLCPCEHHSKFREFPENLNYEFVLLSILLFSIVKLDWDQRIPDTPSDKPLSYLSHKSH